MRPERLFLHCLLLGGALSSGCAALMSPDCGQDWYDTGLRDGRMAAQPWDIQYAASCGARFDGARYVSGWQAGFSARPIPQGQ